MKIVILDGYTANPGDVSWDEIAALGELVVYDRTAPEETAERIQGAELVLTNKVVLDGETIRSAEALKYIGVIATGYNVVDLDAARERGIPVTNIPGYSTDAVVQMTFALLLELMNHTALHSDSVHNGDWCRSLDFCYLKAPVLDLAGKTMGIFGFGSIGQRTAAIAQAFGMKVLACTHSSRPLPETDTLKYTDLDGLLAGSDVLSLHCPYTPETKELMRADTLARMKDGAFLINTARGGCVCEADVAAALQSGKLAGYGADVVSVEPMAEDNPLLHAPNSVITPHIAWASVDSRKRLITIAAQNIQAFLSGSPINNVWAK